MATVNPAATTSTAASAPSVTKAASTGFGDNLNSFLNLLTTQLKNQDPLSPLDTNQFTQQLVSFSQVEQAIKTNDKLANMVTLLSASQLVDTLPLVGKTVEIDSASTGLQGGEATFSYRLPATASQTNLTVTDAAGTIVYTAAGNTALGTHQFVWDGTDKNGKAVPDGVYKLEVGAARLDGTIMTVPVTAIGRVDGVTQKDGVANLSIGQFQVPTTKLVGVRNN
jgi:flagellar basal-body rod modification protein FlgD